MITVLFVEGVRKRECKIRFLSEILLSYTARIIFIDALEVMGCTKYSLLVYSRSR
jgi:hypothetical protein